MLKYENKYYLKAKELVDQINQNLPQKIEATCYTLNSKLPFKVFSLRELLIHRIGELSFVAINSFKNENIVPSIILIRSVFETTAVLVRLSNKIENVLKNNNEIDAFDDFLMKSLFGCRDGSNDIQAYNILTLVDHVRLSQNSEVTKK